MADTSYLPLELWWRILDLLPGRDLCSVALVSRYFRDMMEDPALWRNVRISRRKLKESGLGKMLANNRLRRVTEVDLSYLDLTTESVKILRTVVGRFENIRMKYSLVTEEQKEAVLRAAVNSEVLQRLDVDSVNLCLVHGDLVSSSLAGRRAVGLNNTGLSHDQLVTLLTRLPSLSRVEDLTLSGNSLSSLPPGLLSAAVSQVRRLDLGHCGLSPDQLSSVLCECLWSTSVEELSLAGADLGEANGRGVSPQLLMDAASCLRVLDLCSARLTRKHQVALLTSLTMDCSTLEELDLSGQDLSGLPANLLARSLTNLGTVNLNYTKATTEQLTAVLRSLARTRSAAI